jgi:hypothetical protein
MLTPQRRLSTHGAQVLEDSAVVTGAGPADPPQFPARAVVSRRSLLAASAAAAGGALPLLLTACKGIQALGTPPPPAPDIVALRSAIAAEEVIVARYTAVVRQFGSSGGGATPALNAAQTVLAEHGQHLVQLKSRLIQPPGSTPSPSPSPRASATPSGSVPTSLAAALTDLAQAEQTASDRLIGQLEVLPASLAQLFASIAASEATHVPFLQAAGRR